MAVPSRRERRSSQGSGLGPRTPPTGSVPDGRTKYGKPDNRNYVNDQHAVITLAIIETPGTCRWCGCTEELACPGPCGWANRGRTLCTACVYFDRAIRTARGRAAILGAYHSGLEEQELEAVLQRPWRKPRPRRSGR